MKPGEDRGTDDIAARHQWFLALRALPDHPPRPDAYARALERKREIERRFTPPVPPSPPGGAGAVNWVPLGPSMVASQLPPGTRASGRITALAVGPGGRRIYAGAANGGVWCSRDGGARWVALDDYAASPPFAGSHRDALAIGALAVLFDADESGAHDVVYVGTGEPFIRSTSQGYFSTGIRVSVAGGAAGSWTLEARNLAGNGGVYAIVIDPDDPSVVYAATNLGLYRRAAPGDPWTRIESPAFPNNEPAVTALIVAGRGPARRYYAALHADRVYRSPDGAAEWTAVPGMTAFGRVELAWAERDPDTVYALADTGTRAALLYRLQAGTFVPIAAPDLFNNRQGWYDIALAVDPVRVVTQDPFFGHTVTVDRVYLGGDVVPQGNHLALYRGLIFGGPGTSYDYRFWFVPDIGADPSWIGRDVHPDIHAIAFATNVDGTRDGTQVWLGTDGGVFRSVSGGGAGSYESRNSGLAITQMTFVAQRPDTDAVVFAGSQDQGTVRHWGEQAWFDSPTGDGGGIVVDPNDPYRVMRQYTRAELWACSDGGITPASWALLPFPPQLSSDATEREVTTLFYSRLVVSPAGTQPTLVVYCGVPRVWLTPDWGTTWFTLPSGVNPHDPATPRDLEHDTVTSHVLDAEFSSGTRLYAVTSTTVWRFDHSGSDWRAGWTRTEIPTAAVPLGIICLALEDPAAERLYVGRSGYAGFGAPLLEHVWYYDGATGTWHPTGFTDPDVPVTALVVDPAHPSTVYAATDIGCWQGGKSDGPGGPAWTWRPFSQGLPECAILDLAIHPRARLLRAATHGRGVWEIPLDAVTADDPDLYLRVNYADTGRLAGPDSTRFPWVEGAADPTRKGRSVYHWMSADIKVRRGSRAGLPALEEPPDYFDFSFNIGDYVDGTGLETADAPGGVNRIFVQVHNRAVTPVPGSAVRVLLLLTDAAAGLPLLPADYAARINEGSTDSAWLEGTLWYFADPVRPYRLLPADLDVRTPQIVEYEVDFATVGLPLPEGHVHVCAAAFVTTITTDDKLVSTSPDLDQLTMRDKHVAHRNLHLVVVPAPPPSPPDDSDGGSGRARDSSLGAPRTMLVRLHNATRKDRVVDLVVERPGFSGGLTLMLPRLPPVRRGAPRLTGWQAVGRQRLKGALRSHLDRWLRAVDGLARKSLGSRGKGAQRAELVAARRRDVKSLDRRQVYVADPKVDTPVIAGIPIAAGDAVTIALTVQAPGDARPGDRSHFHVIQKRGRAIVGGSTYVAAVARAPRARKPPARLTAASSGRPRTAPSTDRRR